MSVRSNGSARFRSNHAAVVKVMPAPVAASDFGCKVTKAKIKHLYTGGWVLTNFTCIHQTDRIRLEAFEMWIRKKKKNGKKDQLSSRL